jgi:hypothetical protein
VFNFQSSNYIIYYNYYYYHFLDKDYCKEFLVSIDNILEYIYENFVYLYGIQTHDIFTEYKIAIKFL